MERCVARYAGWVTNQADAAKVSRGTLYAALAATGQCDDGAAYTGTMLSGAQCAAVNPGVAADDCAAHMVSSKSFGITTLAPGLTSQSAPNAGQVNIAGSFAYDNVFLIDGVDGNDNLFGSSNDLFIEDAVRRPDPHLRHLRGIRPFAAGC
jgi:hypothetical protein